MGPGMKSRKERRTGPTRCIISRTGRGIKGHLSAMLIMSMSFMSMQKDAIFFNSQLRHLATHPPFFHLGLA